MEDFKEVVYFAIGLFMAAFIITLVSMLGATTHQMADVRNGEIMAQEDLRLSRKYQSFNNQTVTGGDVIAMIRENAQNGNLQIYVDRNYYGSSMYMTEGNYKDNTWTLAQLLKSMSADAVYSSILVYDGDNPQTATYTINSKNSVTGIKFTLN